MAAGSAPSSWEPSAPGVLNLPSGRLVRGRSLRAGVPDGELPDFGLYLLGRRPPPTPWPARWLRWPDFRLPADLDEARDALADVWQRAAGERAEVACAGGVGRTGTALACLAVLDGVPAADAVAFVREHYARRAVETRGQARFVERFGDPGRVPTP
jgi:protein-tyrosine phosphatase